MLLVSTEQSHGVQTGCVRCHLADGGWIALLIARQVQGQQRQPSSRTSDPRHGSRGSPGEIYRDGGLEKAAARQNERETSKPHLQLQQHPGAPHKDLALQGGAHGCHRSGPWSPMGTEGCTCWRCYSKDLGGHCPQRRCLPLKPPCQGNKNRFLPRQPAKIPPLSRTKRGARVTDTPGVL